MKNCLIFIIFVMFAFVFYFVYIKLYNKEPYVFLEDLGYPENDEVFNNFYTPDIDFEREREDKEERDEIYQKELNKQNDYK